MSPRPLFVLFVASAACAVGILACSSDDDDTSPAKDAGSDATTAKLDSGTSPLADAGPILDAAPSADAAVDAGRVFSTDPTTFFGASRCADSGTLFCDGFESSFDASAYSQAVSTGDTLAVDTSQFARGSSSLHVLLNGPGEAELVLKSIFPVVDDRYFGRVFVRFHQVPRAPATYAHWTFAAATGTGQAGETRLSSQFETSGKSLGNLFSVGTDTGSEDGGTGDWTNNDKDPGPDGSAPEVIPVDQWLCIEWMNDGTADRTDFWWDGVDHPSLQTYVNVPGRAKDAGYYLPTYTQAWIGLAVYGETGQPTDQQYEAWFDEMAYDTQRIGCSN